MKKTKTLQLEPIYENRAIAHKQMMDTSMSLTKSLDGSTNNSKSNMKI